MELFARKIYSRIASEMAMTAMFAESDYFEENQQADLNHQVALANYYGISMNQEVLWGETPEPTAQQ